MSDLYDKDKEVFQALSKSNVEEQLSNYVSESNEIGLYINAEAKDIPLLSSEEVFLKYVDENKPFSGKYIDRIYSQYCSYVKRFKVSPYAKSKFVSQICADFKYGKATINHSQYFYDQEFLKKVLLDFLDCKTSNDIAGKTIDVIYEEYKRYSDIKEMGYLKKAQLELAIATSFDSIQVESQKLNGIRVKVYAKKKEIFEENGEIAFNEWIKDKSEEQLLHEVASEAYKEYCSFCKNNGYGFVGRNVFAKLIRKEFNLTTNSQRVKRLGKNARVFIKDTTLH